MVMAFEYRGLLFMCGCAVSDERSSVYSISGMIHRGLRLLEEGRTMEVVILMVRSLFLEYYSDFGDCHFTSFAP